MADGAPLLCSPSLGRGLGRRGDEHRNALVHRVLAPAGKADDDRRLRLRKPAVAHRADHQIEQAGMRWHVHTVSVGLSTDQEAIQLLRVGLTGGIGSGKSTVAAVFTEQGLAVIEADAVGRDLMQPGQPTFDAIVDRFGQEVVRADGMLDRSRLAELAFRQERLKELNAIVHPAVITAQEEWMRALFASDPEAVAVVESALIFEASQGEDATIPGWRERFDRIVLVTAPDQVKIARYVERVMARETRADSARRNEVERDARARLARQIPDAEKIRRCDYVIDNAGDLESLRLEAVRVATELRQMAAMPPGPKTMPPRENR